MKKNIYNTCGSGIHIFRSLLVLLFVHFAENIVCNLLQEIEALFKGGTLVQ